MNKRGILGILIGLFSINLVSAFSTGYTNFDFRGLFTNVDASFIVYGTIFIVLFAFLSFILGRTLFRENTAIKTIIAFCISALSIYGMATSPAVNINSILYATPFFDGLFHTLMPFLFTAAFIFLGVKFGWGRILMIAGTIAIAIPLFTEWVYAKGALITIGIIVFLIGLKLHRIKKKKKKIGEMNWWEKRKYEQKKAKRKELRKKIGKGAWKGITAPVKGAYGLGKGTVKGARRVAKAEKQARKIRGIKKAMRRKRHKFADKRGLPSPRQKALPPHE